MMRSILYLVLLSCGLFMACNDEPAFPDPGLDTIRDVRDTVRRDTLDTYFLEMHVNTQNGVQTIQILNGLNYRLEDEVSEYNGQKDFLFRYPVDLTRIDLENDTTLHYIVKVIDNDNRSYNKAFALTVKPFSAPTITVSGVEGTLGLVSPVFQLNVLFETGLNTIRSYAVEFEGETLDEYAFEEYFSEYRYSHVFSLELEKERDYTLTIRLTDSQGATKSKDVTLRLVELQRPIQVMINTYSNGNPRLNRILEFHYNKADDSLLDSISKTIYANSTTGVIEKPYTLYFTYNERKQVVCMSELNYSEGTKDSCMYEYDEAGRLLKVKGSDEDYDVECTEWYDDGRVKRWAYAKDMPVTNEAAWQYTPAGDPLMAEVWTDKKKRRLGTRFSSVVIPGYMPALPPWGLVDEEIETLLMHQCGVETVHTYDDRFGIDFESYWSEDPVAEFGYSTNVNGRLEKIVKRENKYGQYGISRDYIFVYDD